MAVVVEKKKKQPLCSCHGIPVSQCLKTPSLVETKEARKEGSHVCGRPLKKGYPCRFTARSIGELELHVAKVHPDGEERTCAHKGCTNIVESTAPVSQTFCIDHRKKATATGAFNCPDCTPVASFRSAEELRKHVVKAHPALVEKIPEKKHVSPKQDKAARKAVNSQNSARKVASRIYLEVLTHPLEYTADQMEPYFEGGRRCSDSKAEKVRIQLQKIQARFELRLKKSLGLIPKLTKEERAKRKKERAEARAKRKAEKATAKKARTKKAA